MDPQEKVSLGEHSAFQDGLTLLEEKAFEGYKLLSTKDEALQLRMFIRDENLKKDFTVKVSEGDFNGPVDFHCSVCDISEHSCPHQWASYTVLWNALKAVDAEEEYVTDEQIQRLSADLKGSLYLRQAERMQNRNTSAEEVTLESISLYVEDLPFTKDTSLGSLLKSDFSKYRALHITKDKEVLAPSLWNMPEVFRRKLTAFSESYFNEVNEQNRSGRHCSL